MNTIKRVETFSLRDGLLVPEDGGAMRFPAGEAHAAPQDPGTGCCVIVRGTHAEDYLEAAMWVDAQRRAGAGRITLAVPYLPGARADRGTPLGAEVYARLVHLVAADRVVAFDPHSPVMPSLLEDLVVYPAWRIIRHALARRVADGWASEYVGVIAPDEGARRRAGSTARALGIPLLQARKHRDFATGRLSGFSVEPLPEAGKLLVVDDICDGGGTFLGLAGAAGIGPERLDLWVTHGVFSGRAERLREHYGQIHTTDSLPSAARADVGAHIHPLTATILQEAAR